MRPHTRGNAAREATQARDSLLDIIEALVFAFLPLSVQAITLPALSKAWKQWAQDQRAKERVLEQAECAKYITQYGSAYLAIIYVPLWLAQQQRPLSYERKRRLQLLAVVCGDVDVANSLGGHRHARRRLLCSGGAQRAVGGAAVAARARLRLGC